MGTVFLSSAPFVHAYVGFPGGEFDDLWAFWVFCIDTMLWEISETLHPPCDLLTFPVPAGSEREAEEYVRQLMDANQARRPWRRRSKQRQRLKAMALDLLLQDLGLRVDGHVPQPHEVCALNEALHPQMAALDSPACDHHCPRRAAVGEA